MFSSIEISVASCCNDDNEIFGGINNQWKIIPVLSEERVDKKTVRIFPKKMVI